MHQVRKILHIDMDAFYASVEQRDDPSLKGRPVIVGWAGERSVVCAASYEARKFGVHSAMPASRAKRLCPEGVWLAPDFERYRAVSKQIREIFERHTPLVEPLSLDEAYLDVTVELTGIPTATETAEKIRAEIREETRLTASAGVAPNKFLAKIASDWRKPDGLFVIRPHQVERFLVALPVRKIPGVGKATEAVLHEMKIETVGDLYQFDEPALVDAVQARQSSTVYLRAEEGVEYGLVLRVLGAMKALDEAEGGLIAEQDDAPQGVVESP
jgi:DNA polymerase-4